MSGLLALRRRRSLRLPHARMPEPMPVVRSTVQGRALSGPMPTSKSSLPDASGPCCSTTTCWPPHGGLAQIEKIVRLGVRVDFNQGLDARRIARNPELAELLARVRWLRFLRMAYDSHAVQEDVYNAVKLLVKCGLSPRKLFFYVLVHDDIGDALERIRELKALGCVPFAQPYRDFSGDAKPSREAWRLAYWCNNKRLFNAMDFADYKCK